MAAAAQDTVVAFLVAAVNQPRMGETEWPQASLSL